MTITEKHQEFERLKKRIEEQLPTLGPEIQPLYMLVLGLIDRVEELENEYEHHSHHDDFADK
jgi:hypothetical protein